MGKSSSAPSTPKIPKPPPIGGSYNAGVQLNLQNLPQQLAAEQAFRGQIDPQRVQNQQDLQQTYGANQYAQQDQALQQTDPMFWKNNQDLGATLNYNLSQGSSLSPSEQAQTEQYVRAAQAQRGNTSGGASATAEAYALGDRGQQLQQQRISNVQNYLHSPTDASQISSLAPVSADRSSAYVDPNAGFQGLDAANQLYQSQVGGIAANAPTASGSNPWGSALSTAGSVAQIAGAFASDRRLKKDIQKVGTGPRGVGIYDFALKNQDVPRYRGLIADDVQKHVPGAVTTNPQTGMKAVDYQRAIGARGPMRIQ